MVNVPDHLPTCHYLGPYDPDEPPALLTVPGDWSGDPFEYLPPPYVMSAEELELAHRYEQCDISGGYIRSQVAHFRKPKSPERHRERKAARDELLALAARDGFRLPDSLLVLLSNDDYNDRIRHNTIWLELRPVLVPFPGASHYKLVELFYEAQGCGSWALLLKPDGSHAVVCYDDSLCAELAHSGRKRTDITTLTFYHCATNFDEWLAYYFLDCRNSDEIYEQLLEQFPGM